MDVLFIVDGGGFYNGKAFNESCQGMTDHESIPNFKVREGWCINFRGWWEQGARMTNYNLPSCGLAKI